MSTYSEVCGQAIVMEWLTGGTISRGPSSPQTAPLPSQTLWPGRRWSWRVWPARGPPPAWHRVGTGLQRGPENEVWESDRERVGSGIRHSLHTFCMLSRAAI